MNEIFERVVELIAGQMPVEKDSVKMETRLVEDLGADSANLMMLIMDLESEYDLTVDDEVLPNIKTVGDIVNYIQENA